MATDQGKLGNVNAIAILAEATGRSMDQVGTTTFRPYLHAGFLRRACRRPSSAIISSRCARRRCMTGRRSWARSSSRPGLWMRSSWFPLAGEDWLAAATREVLGGARAVGICDVSTLGKIDVQGPDAANSLNRLYCNTFSTLQPSARRAMA